MCNSLVHEADDGCFAKAHDRVHCAVHAVDVWLHLRVLDHQPTSALKYGALSNEFLHYVRWDWSEVYGGDVDGTPLLTSGSISEYA